METQWGPSPHSSPFPLSSHAYCCQTVAHRSKCWALVFQILGGFWAVCKINRSGKLCAVFVRSSWAKQLLASGESPLTWAEDHRLAIPRSPCLTVLLPLLSYFLPLVMVALCNRADHYIFILFRSSSSFFFLLLFFPRWSEVLQSKPRVTQESRFLYTF